MMASEPVTASLQFERKLREYCRHLSRSTIAFIWPSSEPAPETGGTGILLQVAPDFHFAITAAHVAKRVVSRHEEHRVTLVAGASDVEQEPILVDGVRLISSHLRVRDGDIDLLDTAAFRLSDRMVERLLLARNRFLTLNDLDISVECESQSCFYVVGYPINGQPRPDFQQMVIARDPFIFCTYLAKNEARQLVVYVEELGIALGFNPQPRPGPSGELEYPPDPNGISGCGIWRLGSTSVSFAEWRPEDAKLVGIQHKVVASPRLMVGTQIRCVLQLLLDQYPALADAMRSAFRLA